MEEEEAFERAGRYEVHARFRRVLDSQMEECRELRGQEAAAKQKEIDDMRAQIVENARIKHLEESVEEGKIEMMKQANDKMFASLAIRKQKQAARKQKDRTTS